MFSSSTRSDSVFHWLAGAVPALALLLSGCGYAPGDYIVYRLNLDEPRLSDGCYYPLSSPPPGTDESSSSRNIPATWVLYFGTDDRVVLDIETTTLEGSETDDGYEFEAYAIDTSYVGADQDEAKITVVRKGTVTMAVDGAVMEGTLSFRTSTECRALDGTGSSGACGSEIPDCVRTQSFVGVQLVDVDLESDVGKPDPF